MDTWVARERRTAQLVRVCYRRYVQESLTPEKIHALCRLTWITKGGGSSDSDLPDNTAAAIAPALGVLTGYSLSARSPAELARALRYAQAPEDVARLASCPVGYTNFYAGFRNISRDWISKNFTRVQRIVRDVAGATSDGEVRRSYSQLERLPPLPRPGAGDMAAYNLLTPLLACLDVRGRTPIINSRRDVMRRLGTLGLRTVRSSSSTMDSSA